MEELHGINEMLKNCITDHTARIRITIETGYDEAGIIATANGYLRLAQFLVEFVLKAEAQQAEMWQINERAFPGSAKIGAIFGPTDEVRIDAVVLAATEREVSETAEAALSTSPLLPNPNDQAK